MPNYGIKGKCGFQHVPDELKRKRTVLYLNEHELTKVRELLQRLREEKK